MSNLPGNPHHALSEAAQTEHGANVHATLALAYEQRTANLIAYMQLEVSAQVAGVDIADEVASDLAERLGIELPDVDA